MMASSAVSLVARRGTSLEEGGPELFSGPFVASTMVRSSFLYSSQVAKRSTIAVVLQPRSNNTAAANASKICRRSKRRPPSLPSRCFVRQSRMVRTDGNLVSSPQLARDTRHFSRKIVGCTTPCAWDNYRQGC